MKSIYVKDIKPGSNVNSTPFVVVKVEKKVAKNAKEYLDVTLGDKTGSIVCKVWGDKYSACSADALVEGLVVIASGTANEFLNKVQMVLSMAVLTKEYEEVDFVPVSNKNVDQMMNVLFAHIASIEDRHLKTLLNNIFQDEKFTEIFKKTPAALKYHHAFAAGLLEHTLEVVDFAIPIANYYKPCNKDMVIAGAILHDIGKVEEIVWKNMCINYSDKGRLLGHIYIGTQIVNKYVSKDFNGECLNLLQHIILSHHGKKEMGAVVIPATIEAKIVSLADDASAKMRSYMSMFEDGQEGVGSFSDYNRALETAVYIKEYQSELEILMEQSDTLDQKLKQLELI
ncbi:MAG: HD domain-containing protein [bacterium]|nr:HD domain-containing protein [bacterium]